MNTPKTPYPSVYRVALDSDGRYSITHYTTLFDVESPTVQTIEHKTTEYDAEQNALVRATRLSAMQGQPVIVETLINRYTVSVTVSPLS